MGRDTQNTTAALTKTAGEPGTCRHRTGCTETAPGFHTRGTHLPVAAVAGVAGEQTPAVAVGTHLLGIKATLQKPSTTAQTVKPTIA